MNRPVFFWRAIAFGVMAAVSFEDLRALARHRLDRKTAQGTVPTHFTKAPTPLEISYRPKHPDTHPTSNQVHPYQDIPKKPKYHHNAFTDPKDQHCLIQAQGSILYDRLRHECTATGRTRVARGHMSVYGDKVHALFDPSMHMLRALWAQGHIALQYKQAKAYGDRLELNTSLQTARLTAPWVHVISQPYAGQFQKGIAYHQDTGCLTSLGSAILTGPEDHLTAQRVRVFLQDVNPGASLGTQKLGTQKRPSLSAHAAPQDKPANLAHIQRVEAVGNVCLRHLTHQAQAQTMLYHPKQRRAQLIGRVRVRYDNHEARAQQGFLDFHNNRFKLVGNRQQGPACIRLAQPLKKPLKSLLPAPKGVPLGQRHTN
jgi:lipopolysaccharide export system protein LptA